MARKCYKVLDLFSGAGGFSLGFKKFVTDEGYTPFEIVGAVENDTNAANTLIDSLVREGMSFEKASAIVISEDITDNGTKEKLYNICPEVDVIIGGPPCQSFSLIGPRSGCKEKQARFANDDRDSLFYHYIEIVNHYKPLFFVFENVKGITSKKQKEKPFIDLITGEFEKIGYKLNYSETEEQKYIVLNSADFGVPQLRERVFVIGNRLGIINPVPVKTHCPPELTEESGLLPYVALKEAIGDLPEVLPKITFTAAKKGLSLKDVSEERKLKILKKNKKRNNGSEPAPFHWERFNQHYETSSAAGKKFLDFIKPKDTSFNELTGHIARSHQESDIKIYKGMEEGMSSKHLITSSNQKYRELASLIKYKMDSFKDKYKKLSWDKPCSTVFAHMQKDGNRFIHPDSRQARTLTVREAARIQSFPDYYTFNAIGNVRFKYIGNAVPPLVAMAIAGGIYKSIVKSENITMVSVHGH